MDDSLCVYRYGKHLKNIMILRNGAIIVGKTFSIDGFSEKPIRVITHAHADHVRGLEESLKYSKCILASRITLDLIETLGYISADLMPLLKSKGTPIDYHQVYDFDGDKIEFYRSDHIPGSVQVLIKPGGENIAIGYTGDFKLTDKTEILQNVNVLITEATYGNPLYVRPFKDGIPQILVDLVVEGLSKHRRVYIYAYHGKIQEAMLILRSGGIDRLFVLPEKVYRATRLLEQKYGFNYGRYCRDHELINMNAKDKLIIFRHFNNARSRKLDGSGLHIILTGKLAREPFIKIDDYTYVVSLSDHADFSELVRYIELSNPELVVIDGSRSSDAELLKRELLERGYCAIVLP